MAIPQIVGRGINIFGFDRNAAIGTGQNRIGSLRRTGKSKAECNGKRDFAELHDFLFQMNVDETAICQVSRPEPERNQREPAEKHENGPRRIPHGFPDSIWRQLRISNTRGIFPGCIALA